MMKLGCKAYDLRSGLERHITGTWKSVEDMRDNLMKDGFVILTYWKE